MGSIFIGLYRLFVRKPILFAGFVLFVAAVSIAGIKKLNITENIFAILPKGQEFQKFNSLLESKNISDQVVFSLTLSKDSNPDEYTDVAEHVKSIIDSVATNFLSDVTAVRPDVQQEVYDYYFSHFPLLIDSNYYSLIERKTKNDSITASIQNNYEKLTNPSGLFIKQFILNDPLNITAEYFKQIGITNNNSKYIVEDGIIFTPGKKAILITGRLNYDNRDAEKNIQLSNQLAAVEKKWNSENSEYKLSHFGTFEIAAQNAVQIKKDTNLTMILSLSLIMLILVLYYRKLSIPILFILPAVFGGMLALGAMGFLRPEISAISLATGAIVIGIILDYSFHFFTHLQHTKSIEETLKEITVPLLTGSITTVLALLALNYTNSVVLGDFGLFASLALGGSAFFTLAGLPVIITITRFDYTKHKPVKLFKLPVINPSLVKFAIVAILLITVFFYFEAYNIRFNSDVEALSFHPSELKNKEAELTGINPSTEKKIYLIAASENYESAVDANYKAGTLIKNLTTHDGIKNTVSTADFFIPDSLFKQRQENWKQFWKANKERVNNQINYAANTAGFSDKAFAPFHEMIDNNTYQPLSKDLLKTMGLDLMVDSGAKESVFISSFIVSTSQKDSVKALFKNIPNLTIFDRSEMASLLLESVRSDFNYLLYLTAGMVFFTLLIIYGRIELALLAFMPMVISWIWILGISSMFNIEFNFVNIVITTFIFGLGDDFSIFVTDGLLNRYKFKKDNLKSYQAAILLSALTVVVGTGVLYFAKHPAIHSIAALSVIGISCILLISFLVQPFIFKLFVERRIKNGHNPISFLQLFMSVFCFTYFISGCLLFYPVLLLISIFPVPVKTKRKVVNFLTSKFAASVLYSGIHVKKKFHNLDQLDFKKPSIIIANHSSFLDIMIMLMLNRKVIIMAKDWVYRSPLFGMVVRYVGYIFSEDGTEENITNIKTKMDEGYSIMIFPEGSRSSDGSLNRFHKGAFYLAEKLNADIQPIMIHGAGDVSPKNEMMVKDGTINVKALPRIFADDLKWGSDYRSRQKSISFYFKEQYKKFKDEREDADYLWRKVYFNYIFKGPVIEWYGRIKWNLEKKNYDFYNSCIGNRLLITDLGCGYGFMDLYLHYKNGERKISALDYDEDKIAIAYNVWNKSDNLQFKSEDITQSEIPPSEVIFLNDVLHYLKTDSQENVLQKCVQALLPGGIIFIRDGVTDDIKHGNTKFTELLSTKIFSFNKKTSNLNFFSADYIYQFGKKHNLKVAEHKHSKKTSNRLFVLSK
ncbi:MAG TPA: 1-acyl-sn-glycerol-3-phosphate acyltransferase [Bacteroidia bacterium]|nr:1-acyl-sn-glycerol-3-phosphate acyltransferase [Bacteroidia bacterium]HMU19735.1 1-acyl-sn-glycerol-3-phosphate acyltransferase [Bacteroidia bacterium]